LLDQVSVTLDCVSSFLVRKVVGTCGSLCALLLVGEGRGHLVLHDHLLEGLGIDALPLVIAEDLGWVLVVGDLSNFQVLVVTTVVFLLEAELFNAVTVNLELLVTELVDA
tara:strand:+ start:282 stop:611 length:330 start_codon:yes stop_codon:yes gene_type:complete